MISAIVREISERKDELGKQSVGTVYFGGGTPSLLTKGELDQLIAAVRMHFIVLDKAEITLEANPEDVNEENLINWKGLGINRLSIGVQSFREDDLQWMNRAHSVDEAKEAVYSANEYGFENITVDLIYGLPGLSLDEWENHVRQVIELNVPHISAYCLTVERKTALHHRVRKGELKIPEDDLQAAQFSALVDILSNARLEQYEISNFARRGWESRHNSSYWKGVSYLGFGPSAHSFNGSMRRWNFAHNRKYMDGLERGAKYWEEETLSAEDHFNELLLTGLRTREGVDLSMLTSLMEPQREFHESVNRFISQGWVVVDSERIQLTQEGKLRADYIASELFVVSVE